MDDPAAPFDLGIQLAIAAALVLTMIVVHSMGLVGISRLLRLERERLLEHDFNVQAIALLGTFGLLLFSLHIAEICIFAGFYLSVGALDSLEEALYYSASAYATLGRTAEYFPDQWRLIGALEALIGFILIGWSTAFMVTTMRRLTD